MGSLMAGWSTQSRDMKSEKLRRNKSLIKEEIEAYWNTKKRLEEGQVHNEQGMIDNGSTNMMQRSFSMPVGEQKERAMESMHTNDCWWTRSSWAFLNEPPLEAMEGPSYKYAAQYHVADLNRAKTTSSIPENTTSC